VICIYVLGGTDEEVGSDTTQLSEHVGKLPAIAVVTGLGLGWVQTSRLHNNNFVFFGCILLTITCRCNAAGGNCV
jgi:hypothetical protein